MTPLPTAGVLALGLAVAGLLGCSPFLPRPAEQTPVRWIVVEKRASEVVDGGWVGDGRLEQQSVMLTLQPLYREDLEWEVVVQPHEFFVEVLELVPSRQAVLGETVSTTVRVGRANPNDHYRLVARPSSGDVQILGEAEHRVRGASPVVFQFTSSTAGRGGISVGVEQID